MNRNIFIVLINLTIESIQAINALGLGEARAGAVYGTRERD
jgi:hypothetical protein